MQASLTDRTAWLWWFAAALAGVLIALWWQPRIDRSVVTSTPAAAPAPMMANPVPARVLGAAAAARQAAPPIPALTLVGTVLAGSGSFATVRRSADSQLLQVRVGDRVDNLVVGAIESDRVVLTGAAQPVVVEADPTARASAPPPRAATPAAMPPVEQPVFAEGEAPWDLAPPFRH